MIQGQFTSQDKCEYVLRETHYRSSRGFRHIRRKLAKLKVFIILTLFSFGGGAAAVYLPALLNPSSENGLEMTGDPKDLIEKVKKDPALLEQLKQEYGVNK